MFERVTPEARVAVVHAKEFAVRFKHASIGSEHLLLGLAVSGDVDNGDVAAGVLSESGLSVEVLSDSVVRALGEGELVHEDLLSMNGTIDLVMRHALREALSMSCGSIGTGHVLLGVLDTNLGACPVILEDAGVDSQVLYRTVWERMGVTRPPRGPRQWHKRRGWQTT